MYNTFLTRNTYPNKNLNPIVEGNGLKFKDANGKEYIDFCSQTLNLLFGHCPSIIIENVIKSLRKVSYGSSRFGTQVYLETAEYLNNISPISPSRVNLKMCDGSDANETAIKTAKKYTGKAGVISFNGMHTGQTTQTINIRGYARDKKLLLGTSEEVYFIDPPTKEEEFALTLNKIEKLISTQDIACLIIDPLFINSGLLFFKEIVHYLKNIEKICHDKGVIFIIDENQTFGWFDDIFFSKEYNLNPDIITLGKGITAGILPLAGVIIKEYLDGILDYNEADFTNGGNPSCCMACLQTLFALNSQDYNLKEKGKIFEIKLKEMKERFPQILFRGVGIIWCLDFSKIDKEGSEKTTRVFNKLLEEGLFLRQYVNKLIIKPPIIIKKEEIIVSLDKIMKIMEEIL